MPVVRAEEEIAKGIISLTSVLGELPAPFFRVPGLRLTSRIAGAGSFRNWRLFAGR
jgi:hypothetical protein